MDAGFFQYNAVDSCCRVFRDTLYRKAPSHFCPFLAFGAGNTLLLSGVCDIRYQEPPSYGTEQAFGAKKGLLWYATRFQRQSVQKTGSCGTEEIFGAKKGLLRYTMRLQRANSFQYNT